METSAKTAMNVNEIFMAIGECVCEKAAWSSSEQSSLLKATESASQALRLLLECVCDRVARPVCEVTQVVQTVLPLCLYLGRMRVEQN